MVDFKDMRGFVVAATQHGAGPEVESGPKGSELNDAYWWYRPIEYVPQGPPLKSSLFDRDAGELEQLYTSAVNSMVTPESEDAIRSRIVSAKARLESLQEESPPSNGAPLSNGEGQNKAGS